MALRNTSTEYGSVAKFLHWLVFLMIATLLAVGFYMTGMEDNPGKWQVYGLHKSFGITLFFIVAFRVYWMITNVKLGYPDDLPVWQRKAARGIHHTLYLLMVAMPLSGWLMSTAAGHVPSYFGLFNLPMPFVGTNKPFAKMVGTAHEVIAWIIIVVVSLHILAALKHHFINRDNIYLRMLPGKWQR